MFVHFAVRTLRNSSQADQTKCSVGSPEKTPNHISASQPTAFYQTTRFVTIISHQLFHTHQSIGMAGPP